MFKRILIANRGEIACRIIKTARRMGVRRSPSIRRPTAAFAMSRWPMLRGLHWPANGRELSGDRQDRRGLPLDRRRSRPSRLWISVPSARPFRAPLRRPGSSSSVPIRARSRPWATRSSPESGRGRQGVDRSRPSRRDRGRQARREDRRSDRLSRDDQGFRRRQRQGMRIAHSRAEVAEGFGLAKAEAKASFSDDRVFIEKIHRRSPSHRNPGAGRQAWQRDLSRRARMF